MKWIMPIGFALLTTGCVCATTGVVAYRQVAVVPVVPVVRPVYPVVEPVILDAGYIEPLDVTTTTIDFY